MSLGGPAAQSGGGFSCCVAHTRRHGHTNAHTYTCAWMCALLCAMLPGKQPVDAALVPCQSGFSATGAPSGSVPALQHAKHA